MGNIHRAAITPANIDQKIKYAYKFYFHVLESDKKSALAANGLAIIMAEKKILDSARDVFSRVTLLFFIMQDALNY